MKYTPQTVANLSKTHHKEIMKFIKDSDIMTLREYARKEKRSYFQQEALEEIERKISLARSPNELYEKIIDHYKNYRTSISQACDAFGVTNKTDVSYYMDSRGISREHNDIAKIKMSEAPDGFIKEALKETPIRHLWKPTKHC